MKSQCENKDCTETETIECYLYDYESKKDIIFHYCAKHITENGFCWACGNFWAGVEVFDFNPVGLCPNCKDEFNDEYDIDIDEYEEFDMDDEEEICHT